MQMAGVRGADVSAIYSALIRRDDRLVQHLHELGERDVRVQPLRHVPGA